MKAKNPNAPEMQYSEIYKQIGLMTRLKRTELQLSQEQLAKRAGISSRFLVDLEAGKTNISLASLIAVCEALNLPVKEVLNQKIRQNRKYLLEDITHLLDGLSTEELDGVRDLILRIFRSSVPQCGLGRKK